MSSPFDCWVKREGGRRDESREREREIYIYILMMGCLLDFSFSLDFLLLGCTVKNISFVLSDSSKKSPSFHSSRTKPAAFLPVLTSSFQKKITLFFFNIFFQPKDFKMQLSTLIFLSISLSSSILAQDTSSDADLYFVQCLGKQ